MTELRTIAMLGNHMPRQCGIATFTTDLVDAIMSETPDVEAFVVAMNDPGRRHHYPARVRFELAESDLRSYRRAADFLNVNQVDVLSLQHEYGIFGGKSGAHVLTLLRELRMPIVTTLHTIVSAPSPNQRVVMDELVSLSERLVVMTANGASILDEVHKVPRDKIDIIAHGIPAVPKTTMAATKDKLGLEGKLVILTFGLLSPDKGIETVIEALPAVVKKHPNAVYVVVGATHPHVREHHGEQYRIALEQRARRRGVERNIVFHDRFVTQRELGEFLSAADVYITPYLNPEQITSGTLAYAVGFGKAVISTPYRYARDLLAEERGVLVPFGDAAAIGTAIIRLLDDDTVRAAFQHRAREYGRNMEWPVVARRYLGSFERAHADHAARRRSVFHAKTLAERAQLPDLKLDHVRLMTDGTGILQHAAFDVPRYADGYCLDDNARALLLMTLIEDGELEEGWRTLGAHYLAFVNHSFDEREGRFRNFMSYSRQFTEPHGSDDSHGRALWALGTVVGRGVDPGRQTLADRLFHSALPAVLQFTSPRAWAYALLGINEYLRAFKGDSNVQSVRRTLAARLVDIFKRTSRPDWPWFEESVTYCNARLSQALIVTGARMEDEEMTSIGLRSLDWLCGVQTHDQYFAPIGSNGFYVRGRERAMFDQQPVEAGATVSACLDAWRQTKKPEWLERAESAFQWFLGHNQLQQGLYDARTGGCRDGLHADRANENQGAESTLSFLLALVEMRSAVGS